MPMARGRIKTLNREDIKISTNPNRSKKQLKQSVRKSAIKVKKRGR